jgi:hypothetical protein
MHLFVVDQLLKMMCFWHFLFLLCSSKPLSTNIDICILEDNTLFKLKAKKCNSNVMKRIFQPFHTHSKEPLSGPLPNHLPAPETGPDTRGISCSPAARSVDRINHLLHQDLLSPRE